MKKITTILFALAFAMTGAVSAEETPLLNETCPIKGKDVKKSKSVEYTVEFCCNKCVGKFEKDPASFVSDIAAAEEGTCPISGRDVDPDATSTVLIGVCCGNCAGKVEADPDKYIDELAES